MYDANDTFTAIINRIDILYLLIIAKCHLMSYCKYNPLRKIDTFDDHIMTVNFHSKRKYILQVQRTF